MAYSEAEYAVLFKALADETRLKIVKMLAHEELCACHILREFQITQPTLSYHMKILTESGLVTSKKQGAWIHYKMDEEKIESIRKFLKL